MNESMKMKPKKEPDNAVFCRMPDSSEWYSQWVIFAFLGAILVRLVARVKLLGYVV